MILNCKSSLLLSEVSVKTQDKGGTVVAWARLGQTCYITAQSSAAKQDQKLNMLGTTVQRLKKTVILAKMHHLQYTE